MPTGHLYVFFGEMSVQVFCPFYNLVNFCLFLMLSCMSCVFNLVYWSYHLQVFSPIQQVVFLFFLDGFLCCAKVLTLKVLFRSHLFLLL